MDEIELLAVLKYSSPYELYIVDEDNNLQIICCPFSVRVLIDIGALTIGDIVVVDAVKVTEQLITVFIIQDAVYWYYYFDIL